MLVILGNKFWPLVTLTTLIGFSCLEWVILAKGQVISIPPCTPPKKKGGCREGGEREKEMGGGEERKRERKKEKAKQRQ